MNFKVICRLNPKQLLTKQKPLAYTPDGQSCDEFLEISAAQNLKSYQKNIITATKPHLKFIKEVVIVPLLSGRVLIREANKRNNSTLRPLRSKLTVKTLTPLCFNPRKT